MQLLNTSKMGIFQTTSIPKRVGEKAFGTIGMVSKGTVTSSTNAVQLPGELTVSAWVILPVGRVSLPPIITLL